MGKAKREYYIKRCLVHSQTVSLYTMKVFKFGGASVKDADSVRNVANVLNHFPGEEILIVQ